MAIIKHEEILQELAKKEGLPYEMLRIMFNDFFQQLLMHLQHPENNFIKGIKIRECFKFRLNPKQICRAYCNYLRFDSAEDSDYTNNLKIIHQQLVDNDIYTEKQKKIIEDCERDRVCSTGEEGNYSHEEGQSG